MATERKNGAGSRLASVLERAPQLSNPAEGDDVDLAVDIVEGDPVESKSRGATARKPKTADARAAKRIKGRTIYIPDDLFERILVQAHRRNRTISEYVTAILERQVPDHRVVRTDASESGAA